MNFSYRPMLEILREALSVLQNDPGPLTPEKAELLSYLHERIVAHSGSPAAQTASAA
jgi:hypothetical protein